MTISKDSSISVTSSRRRQKAAERTNISLLRYVLDHPGATCKAAAEDLDMSLPNVFRLVAGFRDGGVLVQRRQKQTGKRGPWSQVVSLRASLGSTVGVDLEATHIRGVALDFANDVVCELRRPVSPTAGPEQITAMVAEAAVELVKSGRKRGMHVYALGLGLPGPVNDVVRGSVRTELQFGKASLEFVPVVRGESGIPTTAEANSYCFTAAHHRMHSPRGAGIEVIILNRFGLSAALIWNGRLYTGASHYVGDLGLLPYGANSDKRYRDVCTGASLLKWARDKGDDRTFQELLASRNDPLVQEWLKTGVPAFTQAISNAVILFNPNSVLIEGMFNKFPKEVKQQIVDGVLDEINRVGNMLPEIRFFEGDDLMGARGAALLARDHIADGVLARIIKGAGAQPSPRVYAQQTADE